MVRQSHATILLTRPMAQSQRFAADLDGCLISPLMRPEFMKTEIPAQPFEALILASETGVEAARRLSAGGAHLPRRVHCVGGRTETTAVLAGLEVVTVAQDAGDLFDKLTAGHVKGPVLFLRAEDSTGDLENRLNSAGIETVSVVTYRQIAQPLTPDAIEALQKDRPVILPIFSPRSARLLAAELIRVGRKAPLWLVALSPAVADAFTFPTELKKVALHPNAAAVLEIVRELQRDGWVLEPGRAKALP